MVEQGWPQGFPQASKDICEKETLPITELARSCEKRIENLKGTFPDDANVGLGTRSYMKLKQLPKTNRVMAELDEMETESKQIEDYVGNLNSLLAKTFQIADLSQSGTSSTDKFALSFRVPCLSGFEVLDFNSLATPEGRLKDLLLNPSTAGLVGLAVWARRPLLIRLGNDEGAPSSVF